MFTVRYGTIWTASVNGNGEYNAGTLSPGSSGTVTSNVTVSASAASVTPSYQIFVQHHEGGAEGAMLLNIWVNGTAVQYNSYAKAGSTVSYLIRDHEAALGSNGGWWNSYVINNSTGQQISLNGAGDHGSPISFIMPYSNVTIHSSGSGATESGE